MLPQALVTSVTNGPLSLTEAYGPCGIDLPHGEYDANAPPGFPTYRKRMLESDQVHFCLEDNTTRQKSCILLFSKCRIQGFGTGKIQASQP
mmetsp:Transcript_1657/g.2198  ORF Transcript_1657/g.2198 Transcript_1657/m.2198 type:complete len:91 (-) Transcript_1657:2681-2953(-)